MARDGADYLVGLKMSERDVWLRGARVEVTNHPAFARPMAQIAKLYDLQHESPEVLLPADQGGRTPVAFVTPRSLSDLVRRRRAYELFAESTLGLMGRSPDFLNTVVTALANGRAHFGALGERYAENVERYYEHVRDNDLFLTHALISPQTDRSRSSAGQSDELLHLGVVRETADGLVVRGARMLATLGALADEIIVYNHPGLGPDDGRHALAFAIPLSTPGLRLICREPFDDGDTPVFDRPFSAHFDESDALVVFDDVLVPWHRVFLHGDVALSNSMIRETGMAPHSAHQTGARGVVKLRLAAGLCIALTRAVKTDRFLNVQQQLGECVSDVETARALLLAAEYDHTIAPDGTAVPNMRLLQTLRLTLARTYPRIIEILQTLGAGGLLMLPSAEDFASPIAEDVARYYQGAEGLPAVDRVRLFKLAWDLAGSAFGQRQVQYERYYGGDPVRLTAAHYLGYDADDSLGLVDRAVALAGDPDPR